MKTLINKNNPQIRITMPDEDVFPRQGTTDTMTILFEKSKRMARQEIDIAMNEWTLVEEETKRKQSPALKKIMDNLTEEKLAKTRAEMKLENTAEPVDLEKELEEFADRTSMSIYKPIYIKDDDKPEHPFDVKRGERMAYRQGIMRGAKWMAEQGVSYTDKIYNWSDDDKLDGVDENKFTLDGFGEEEALLRGVKQGLFRVQDKVIVQIRKEE